VTGQLPLRTKKSEGREERDHTKAYVAVKKQKNNSIATLCHPKKDENRRKRNIEKNGGEGADQVRGMGMDVLQRANLHDMTTKTATQHTNIEGKGK